MHELVNDITGHNLAPGRIDCGGQQWMTLWVCVDCGATWINHASLGRVALN